MIVTETKHNEESKWKLTFLGFTTNLCLKVKHQRNRGRADFVVDFLCGQTGGVLNSFLNLTYTFCCRSHPWASFTSFPHPSGLQMSKHRQKSTKSCEKINQNNIRQKPKWRWCRLIQVPSSSHMTSTLIWAIWSCLGSSKYRWENTQVFFQTNTHLDSFSRVNIIQLYVQLMKIFLCKLKTLKAEQHSCDHMFISTQNRQHIWLHPVGFWCLMWIIGLISVYCYLNQLGCRFSQIWIRAS